MMELFQGHDIALWYQIDIYQYFSMVSESAKYVIQVPILLLMHY